MIDDKKCREVLQEKIAQIKEYPRTAQKEVENIMAKKFNVKYDLTVDIFNNKQPIESQPYHILYKLMVAIREVAVERWQQLNPEDLCVSKYFTKLDEKEFEKPIPKKDNDFDITIPAESWHLTNIYPYYYYTIHTDINEVNKWRDYNKLRFNPETQRDLIKIETNGITISKLDIKKESVSEMSNQMIEGTYTPVTGAININPELNDETVVIKGNDLFISRKIKMDLLEGFHNYLAETDTKDENPDWNFPCEFKIYFYNTTQANTYIKQMDKKNHFRETQTASMDMNDNVTYIISSINSDNGFYLRGSIDKDMFVYLYNLITSIFKLKDITIRDKAMLLENLKNKINKFVVKTDHFDKPLSKEEWFAFLYIINQTKDDNIFDKLLNNDELYKVISELSIAKAPNKNHYKVINDIIKEANNV